MRINVRKYRVPKIVGADEGVPRWLRLSLLLLLLGAVAWLAYQQGGNGLAKGFARLQSGMDRVGMLEMERNELKRELAMLKQTAEVDREALAAVREQIKTFQDERLKMEEELAFLRGIVSTSSKKRALRVQNFKLEAGLEARQFVYKFSVSQVINSGTVVKGRIEITITGLQDGEARQFTLEKLSKENISSHKMRFRYYQNIEGTIHIPEGFEPATILIDVKPSSTKLEPVSESYDWSPLA
jgi:FtsZ-binding cell division protein ZapB